MVIDKELPSLPVQETFKQEDVNPDNANEITSDHQKAIDENQIENSTSEINELNPNESSLSHVNNLINKDDEIKTSMPIHSTPQIKIDLVNEIDAVFIPPPTPAKSHILHAKPITIENFAPFGRLIKAFDENDKTIPENVQITSVNQGTARKFSWLGNLTNLSSQIPTKMLSRRVSWFRSTPKSINSTPISPITNKPNLCVYRCSTANMVSILPNSHDIHGSHDDEEDLSSLTKHARRTSVVFESNRLNNADHIKGVRLRCLERHRFSSQVFIPMTQQNQTTIDSKGTYLVIVAPSLNTDDSLPPDFDNLVAFIVDSTVGIEYAAGVWHHPMIVLGEPGSHIDMVCLVHETGVPHFDCEEWNLDGDYVVSLGLRG